MLNTVRQTGQVTIRLVDADHIPGAYIDQESGSIWVNSNLSDEDMLDLVNTAMLRLLRPQLAAVDSDRTITQQPTETIAPRPKLRLVRAGGDW